MSFVQIAQIEKEKKEYSLPQGCNKNNIFIFHNGRECGGPPAIATKGATTGGRSLAEIGG